MLQEQGHKVEAKAVQAIASQMGHLWQLALHLSMISA